MTKTGIEWCRNPDGSHGYTLNPIRGKCPIACPYCYARRMYDRFKWNPELRWDASVMEQLRTLKKPSGIFMCSTFEWLWNESWAQNIISCCKAYPRHRFYLLTKLPKNLAQFSPFPDNCWVGVTVTEPNTDDTPLAYFSKVEAKIKYISFEPLLKWTVGISTRLVDSFYKAGIKWLIIGACTGSKSQMKELCKRHPDLTLMPHENRWTAQPRIEWVKEIVRAADKANIPVFLKNNLKPLIGDDLRQEMP